MAPWAGADAAPETEATHQLDADGAAPISPTLSTPAPDAETPSLSKPGLAATTRLQACTGTLPANIAGQACLAFIRQTAGAKQRVSTHPEDL